MMDQNPRAGYILMVHKADPSHSCEAEYVAAASCCGQMSLAVKSWKICQGISSKDLPAFTGAGQAGDNTDKQGSSSPYMFTSQ
nr:hypothetical protein [Tanacetum cinerariifolium]